MITASLSGRDVPKKQRFHQPNSFLFSSRWQGGRRWDKLVKVFLGLVSGWWSVSKGPGLAHWYRRKNGSSHVFTILRATCCKPARLEAKQTRSHSWLGQQRNLMWWTCQRSKYTYPHSFVPCSPWRSLFSCPNVHLMRNTSIRSQIDVVKLQLHQSISLQSLSIYSPVPISKSSQLQNNYLFIQPQPFVIAIVSAAFCSGNSRNRKQKLLYCRLEKTTLGSSGRNKSRRLTLSLLTFFRARSSLQVKVHLDELHNEGTAGWICFSEKVLDPWLSLRKDCNYCRGNSQRLGFLWRNARQSLNGKWLEVNWQIYVKPPVTFGSETERHLIRNGKVNVSYMK